jgi:rod shape determining protein RodA
MRAGLHVDALQGAGRIGRSIDVWLLGALITLGMAGLVVLYSGTGGDVPMVQRHGTRLVIGLGLLLLVTQIPLTWLRAVTPWFYIGSILLLVMVAFVGEGRGAQSWLDLGVLRFQPSELVKLSLPMMLAWLFHLGTLPPRGKVLIAAMLLIALPVLMIAEQPDLGTALLVAASAVCLLFLAGLSWRWIVLAVGAVAAAAPLVWQFLHEYQRNRVRTFLDPEADPLGHGWNIIQSKIAVGSGGFSGKGYLAGTQSRLDYLPEHTTDFALAVLAEEFGFVGVVLLLAVCVFITARGLYIASRARDVYSRLLAGALALTFFFYVAANAAMVGGMMPVVGIPMPLVSYGGTSAVTLLVGFGIVMSVQRHQRAQVPRRRL